MTLLALPAPVPRPLLPAPATAVERPEVLLADLLDKVKEELDKSPRHLYILDEASHFFSMPESALTYHTMVMGSSGRGKSLFLPATPLPSAERGKTKLVAVGGDDTLLADWNDLSPVEWTLQWQSWFPTKDGEPVPCICIDEQSASGMLLAVDVAWTCDELEARLGAQFPSLEVNVTLAAR
jgi:hypothetical protein